MFKLKIILLIFFFGYSTSVYLQSDSTKTELICDTLLKIDGSIQPVQITETNRNSLTYILCCENCAVPRKIKLNEIDSIIYAHKLISTDTLQIDVQTKKEIRPEKHNKHAEQQWNESTFYVFIEEEDKVVYKRKIDQKISIATINELDSSIFYKGVLTSINEEYIEIDGIVIPLISIDSIIKPKYGKWIFLGGTGILSAGIITFIIGAIIPLDSCNDWICLFNEVEEAGLLISFIGGGVLATSGIISAYNHSSRKKINKATARFRTYVEE